MKKKITVLFSALFVFALFGAVFALSGTANTVNTQKSAASSCPMHKQTLENASADDQKDSCCGMADCCKDGKCSMGGDCCKDKDSCPMKKNAAVEQTAQNADMSKVIVAGDGDSCCQPGADCCKGGACCHKKS